MIHLHTRSNSEADNPAASRGYFKTVQNQLSQIEGGLAAGVENHIAIPSTSFIVSSERSSLLTLKLLDNLLA